MISQVIKKIVISLFLSIAILVLGCLIAVPISNHYHAKYNDVIFIEGIFITVISLFFSVHGKASRLSYMGLSNKNAQYISEKNLETAKMERESAGYSKNNSVINMTFSRLTILFGGIFLILYSVVMM
jgi:hypothetical protein